MVEIKQKIRSFTDLKAWQEGHTLVLEVYREIKHFPKDEMFGLSSQMKRASVSITSNIAEGFSRLHSKEKIHFYPISLGSLTELQNQLLVARDLGFVEKSVYSALATRTVNVHKMVIGLIKFVRAHS